MEYQAEGRLVARRDRPLRSLRRMDPNGVYYLVTGGVAVVVGIVIDAFSPVPWWLVGVVGLAGAWAFTWVTALDDVRHPWRSLRIVAAVVRHPWEATRIRAAVHELPLYAPSPEWAGTRRLSGGGLAYGPGLLSPARPSASVTWGDDEASVKVRTVTCPPDPPQPGRLPSGIGHQLAQCEDDPDLADVPREEFVDRLRPVDFDVAGTPLRGTVLDLTRQGHGWIAEARVSDRFLVELTGEGVAPDDLPLVVLAANDLP